MHSPSSGKIAKLAVLSVIAVFTFLLLEISFQFVLPATYEVRFSDLRPNEAALIQEDAWGWARPGRPVAIRVSRADPDGTNHRVDLIASIQVVERGFRTLSGLVSSIQTNPTRGIMTFSREPHRLGRPLALLLSTFLFLMLFRRMLVSV